ncbi:MAG: 2,3-bisphosphoglycerate-independent phosphoglycerate mutase [Thermodesulfobacteriota bacterium]
MHGIKPTLLLILDGWGYSEQSEGNAVSHAKTPNLDNLLKQYPSSLLECAGESVGLPEGQMGNSEVGHLNIGAGRIVYQEIVRIDKSIQEGDFFENSTLLQLTDSVKRNQSRLHLMGLVSEGGVHSHQNHIYALLEFAKRQGVEDVLVHAILDGRDTPPRSGLGYVKKLQGFMDNLGIGRIASVSGRYYSMDRDKRWERTELAYNTLILGQGRTSSDPATCVKEAYANGETDEFIIPTIIEEQGNVQDSDAVFFFNFRADRARQLVQSLFRDFDKFARKRVPQLAGLATMTEYDKSFQLPVAFPQMQLKRILSQVCSEYGMRHMKIAETEKYAHVTYFFNGGREKAFEGEERILVPSPQDVATYDLKPEMSVFEVTDKLISNWESGEFELVVCNFANLDMVGHTGSFEATVKACEAVDCCLGKVREAVSRTNGRLLLTSDHGNAEEMLDSQGGVQTAHSSNPVSFVWVEENIQAQLAGKGIIGDIAPTILQMWGLDKPEEMTAEGLLENWKS